MGKPLPGEFQTPGIPIPSFPTSPHPPRALREGSQRNNPGTNQGFERGLCFYFRVCCDFFFLFFYSKLPPKTRSRFPFKRGKPQPRELEMDPAPPAGGGSLLWQGIYRCHKSPPGRDNASSSQPFIHQALSCFFLGLGWGIFMDWEMFREEGWLPRVSLATLWVICRNAQPRSTLWGFLGGLLN